MLKHKKILSFIIISAVILFIGKQYTQTSVLTEYPIATLTEKAKVTRIIDGDTLEVFIKNKKQIIRLLGVDAAEKNKCFFQEATDELTNLTLNKDVILQNDILNNNTDEYKRLLRYIYLKDNTLVNADLIEKGFTKYLSYFPISQKTTFENAEQNAKDNNLGLWKKCK